MAMRLARLPALAVRLRNQQLSALSG